MLVNSNYHAYFEQIKALLKSNSINRHFETQTSNMPSSNLVEKILQTEWPKDHEKLYADWRKGNFFNINREVMTRLSYDDLEVLTRALAVNSFGSGSSRIREFDIFFQEKLFPDLNIAFRDAVRAPTEYISILEAQNNSLLYDKKARSSKKP